MMLAERPRPEESRSVQRRMEVMQQARLSERRSNPLVVGITGYAQHGKDSIAARMVERWGFVRYAFADALKSMAVVLDPLIDLNMWNSKDGPEVKQLHADWRSDHARLSALVGQLGWERAKHSKEVRRFLQVLGTEAVRGHLGDDAWIRALANSIEPGTERVVIPDVRFPNEANFVTGSCLGKLIRVQRLNADGSAFDNGVGSTHPSEQFIGKLQAHYNIVGVSGDMDDLLAKTDEVVRKVVA